MTIRNATRRPVAALTPVPRRVAERPALPIATLAMRVARRRTLARASTKVTRPALRPTVPRTVRVAFDPLRLLIVPVAASVRSTFAGRPVASGAGCAGVTLAGVGVIAALGEPVAGGGAGLPPSSNAPRSHAPTRAARRWSCAGHAAATP